MSKALWEKLHYDLFGNLDPVPGLGSAWFREGPEGIIYVWIAE